MRDGMKAIVRRLRQMTEAGKTDYALADETYWSDDHLLAVLDENRTRRLDVGLEARPEYVSADNIYLRYEMPWSVGNAVEGTAGGTPVFRVYDSAGTTIGAADYTFSERDLAVTFAADQEGSARYWSGYSYNLAAAARQVWLTKAAHAWTAINFATENQKFDREALYKHCMEMAKMYGMAGDGGQGGVTTARMARGDLAGPGDGVRF